PGTGMFLLVSLTLVLRQNFLTATAATKALNTATNIGALCVFFAGGHVLWALAIPLAIANMLGSFLGARIVIARGTGLIRVALLIIVVVLAAKLTFDAISFS
ncbi:MAG: TSUP family transporter, partial [Bowdeniella nasicola]|nr:TSUP family transporter [Bowdeniella nasicola]